MLVAMRGAVPRAGGGWSIPLLILAGVGDGAAVRARLGATVNDARAWVTFGSFSFQPSEFLKLAARRCSPPTCSRAATTQLSDVRRTLVPLIARRRLRRPAPASSQGDLGSAIVLARDRARRRVHRRRAAVAAARRRGRSARSRALAFVFSSRVPLQPVHRVPRHHGQQGPPRVPDVPGLLGIANGGLTGSGVGGGNGKCGYLPLAHSDFIFAVIADELGFVGVVAVVGGFVLLVWFGIQAALAAPDRFGMLLAGGIAAWFGVQAIINIGGVTGLMPVTGLTLPFFSAGGSSLFVSMAAAGLLLNVAARTLSGSSRRPT